jgi:hypothetical protein
VDYAGATRMSVGDGDPMLNLPNTSRGTDAVDGALDAAPSPVFPDASELRPRFGCRDAGGLTHAVALRPRSATATLFLSADSDRSPAAVEDRLARGEHLFDFDAARGC